MRIFVCSWLIAALGFAGEASAQAQTAPSTAHTKAVKVVAVTQPSWANLKPEQQAALAPLQPEWLKMSEAQKRKWLEVSKNYDKLNADEKTKLQERMRDWVKLSPEQRAQARLNFSTAKALTTEEKQKQWQAYQALSPEERQALQTKAKANTPNSAALAAKPQNKIVPVKKPEPKPRTE
jgi:Protein of unknown function (DUF3106)